MRKDTGDQYKDRVGMRDEKEKRSAKQNQNRNEMKSEDATSEDGETIFDRA